MIPSNSIPTIQEIFGKKQRSSLDKTLRRPNNQKQVILILNVLHC